MRRYVCLGTVEGAVATDLCCHGDVDSLGTRLARLGGASGTYSQLVPGFPLSVDEWH